MLRNGDSVEFHRIHTVRHNELGAFDARRDNIMMTTIRIVLLWTIFRCISLTNANAVGDSLPRNPEDFHVDLQALIPFAPGIESYPGALYSGVIPTTLYQDITKKREIKMGKLSFMLFLPDAPAYNDSLVVWLNGGPGCSSFGGALFENAPIWMGSYQAGEFGIPSNNTLEFNEHAWTNTTAMLYVEQPQGTGFSSGPMPQDEHDVSQNFYYFLQNLYTVFGSDLRDKRLSFFGESYAGMYVPSIAHYIHQQNKNTQNKGNLPYINLWGIGLGNAWIDVNIQGPTVIEYAFWHGMIDISTKRALEQEWLNCRDGSKQSEPFHAFTVPDECNIMGAVLSAAGAGAVGWGGPNAYDVTTWDSYFMLDDPQGTMALFFNNPQVQQLMHFEGNWIECMPGAGRRRLSETDQLPGKILLAHDKPVSVVPYIADLLDDAKIHVLIYSGDRDMSTNAQGSEFLLDMMKWSGKRAWNDTSKFQRGLWMPSEKSLGGYMKAYANLGFLVVVNSGHLVPFNQPENSLDLLDRFLGSKSFVDVPLPKFVVKAKRGVARVIDLESATMGITAESSTPLVHFLSICLIFALGYMIGYCVHGRNERKRQGYEIV